MWANFTVGGGGPEMFPKGNRLCMHTPGIGKVFITH